MPVASETDRIEKEIVIRVPRAQGLARPHRPAEFGKWFGAGVELLRPAPRAQGKITHPDTNT